MDAGAGSEAANGRGGVGARQSGATKKALALLASDAGGVGVDPDSGAAARGTGGDGEAAASSNGAQGGASAFAIDLGGAGSSSSKVSLCTPGQCHMFD